MLKTILQKSFFHFFSKEKNYKIKYEYMFAYIISADRKPWMLGIEERDFEENNKII